MEDEVDHADVEEIPFYTQQDAVHVEDWFVVSEFLQAFQCICYSLKMSLHLQAKDVKHHSINFIIKDCYIP